VAALYVKESLPEYSTTSWDLTPSTSTETTAASRPLRLQSVSGAEAVNASLASASRVVLKLARASSPRSLRTASVALSGRWSDASVGRTDAERTSTSGVTHT
jgi:hypothetical protein